MDRKDSSSCWSFIADSRHQRYMEGPLCSRIAGADEMAAVSQRCVSFGVTHLPTLLHGGMKHPVAHAPDRACRFFEPARGPVEALFQPGFLVTSRHLGTNNEHRRPSPSRAGNLLHTPSAPWGLACLMARCPLPGKRQH